MFSTILSGAVYGIECHLVQVEADLSTGLPCFVMVGNLGSEVKDVTTLGTQKIVPYKTLEIRRLCPIYGGFLDLGF